MTWDDSGREGSQRLGGEGKREALLARWLQEGNKRLRQRLAPGGLTRQSDPGPAASGTSDPAHAKVGNEYHAAGPLLSLSGLASLRARLYLDTTVRAIP